MSSANADMFLNNSPNALILLLFKRFLKFVIRKKYYIVNKSSRKKNVFLTPQ